MNTKHTPGPWIQQGRYIVAPNGFTVANLQPMGEHNARLIAAAPDLLALLQRMADGDIMTAYPATHAEVVHEYQKLARAAIEKATGGAK